MDYVRVLSIVLLLVLISQMAIPIAYSSTNSPYMWIRYAHTKIPAVTTVGGNETGTVADLYVSVAYPGNGVVYFSAEPLTELDTQATARIAALVASTIAGKSFTAYDFFIRIKSPSLIIGGPSAGAAMTVAILSILMNQTLNESVMMTGMICPDGSVGPVGGIPAKLEAAAATGIKVFLIPAGQRVTYERVIVKEAIPGGYVIHTKYVPIDLVKLGKKLNVTVIEVASIRDAFYYFTGFNISLETTNISIPALPDNVVSIINSWTHEYLGQANESRTEALSVSSKIPYPVKYIIEGHLNNSMSLEKQARNYLSEKMYYQAASAAFTSYIEAKTALEYSQIYLDNSRLIELSNEVNSTLETVRSKVMNYKPSTFAGFEAVTTARYRYYLAMISYNDSVNIIKNGISSWSDLDKVVYLLVYSEIRADSALKWLELGSIGSPIYKEHALEDIAEALLGIARSSFAYLETLSGDLGSKPPSYSEALMNVRLTEEAYANRDYYGSIAAAIHTTAASVVAIHELFKTAISNIVQVAERESIASVQEVYHLGIVPLVALNYLEAGLSENNTQEEWGKILYYYMLASLYAQVLKMIIESSVPSTPHNTTITELPTIVSTTTRTTTITIEKTHTTTITSMTTTTMIERNTSTTTLTITLGKSNYPIEYLILGVALGIAFGILVVSIIVSIRRK